MANKLYLISPPQIDLPKFAEQFRSAISGGEIRAFQLRLKDTPVDDIRRAVEVLVDICRYDALATFFVNDNIAIAKEFSVGVHLGSDDGEVKTARTELGGTGLIGASCYNSLELAIKAANDGANYVSFGAFYPTTTKVPKAKAEIDTLRQWKAQSAVKCSAIGGITPQNAKPIIDAGADFICAISSIWDHPVSPAKAVEEFLEVIG